MAAAKKTKVTVSTKTKTKTKTKAKVKTEAEVARKVPAKAKPEPQTIDEYLAQLTREQRSVLESVRKTIRAAVPTAEECISYHLPAFASNGKCFVWFGAATKHYAVYGLSEVSKGDLDEFQTSGRGTIRFWADKPLPAALLRKLVKARISR